MTWVDFKTGTISKSVWGPNCYILLVRCHFSLCHCCHFSLVLVHHCPEIFVTPDDAFGFAILMPWAVQICRSSLCGEVHDDSIFLTISTGKSGQRVLLGLASVASVAAANSLSVFEPVSHWYEAVAFWVIRIAVAAAEDFTDFRISRSGGSNCCSSVLCLHLHPQVKL